MQEYLPQEIETKWQNYWEEQGLLDFDFASEKPKYYMLTMLPYPSGDLHIGHWYAMAPSDSYARFMKMQGNDCPLYPSPSPRDRTRSRIPSSA